MDKDFLYNAPMETSMRLARIPLESRLMLRNVSEQRVVLRRQKIGELKQLAANHNHAIDLSARGDPSLFIFRR